MTVKTATKVKLMNIGIEQEYAIKLSEDRKWNDVKEMSTDQISKVCGVGSVTSQIIHKKISDCQKSTEDFLNLPEEEKKKWRARAKRAREKEDHLKLAKEDLDWLAAEEQMNLSDEVIAKAMEIYSDSIVNGKIRKLLTIYVPLVLLAASLYAACRICEKPVNLGEIGRFTGLDELHARKKILNSYKSMIKELNLSIPPKEPDFLK